MGLSGVGGSSLTLDQIEQNILPDFHDPRVYLALGRGAVGGGRLRSEAFTPERLEAQLTEVANECATRPECIHIDRENNKVSVSAIFSWREKDFTSAYAGTVPSVFSNRSPIERAVIGLVGPKLLTIEKDFLDNLSRKMLVYALGRSLQLSDEPLIQRMNTRLAASGYHLSALISTVVSSPQFLNKRTADSSTRKVAN